MEAERAEAGFETMDTYIRKRWNTVAHYIATQSLMGLCKATERKKGELVGMWWWEQAVIDLVGARDTASISEVADKDGT